MQSSVLLSVKAVLPSVSVRVCVCPLFGEAAVLAAGLLCGAQREVLLNRRPRWNAEPSILCLAKVRNDQAVLIGFYTHNTITIPLKKALGNLSQLTADF